MIRDESCYVEEWIRYHEALFGEHTVHFVVLDNKSADGLRKVLSPYIAEKKVTYVYVNAETHPQCQFYTHVVRRFAGKTEFMVFIDTDEFLVPADSTLDVYAFIKEHLKEKHVGGLVVNWLCYGSSGYINKPEGPVLASYLWRSEFSYGANKAVKSIVNPRAVWYWNNPHCPIYKKGFYSVDETGRHAGGAFHEEREYRFLRIHHYAAKSKEDQMRKERLGLGQHLKMVRHANHDQNDVYDPLAKEIAESKGLFV